jgi:hypothetical protein
VVETNQEFRTTTIHRPLSTTSHVGRLHGT